MDDPSLVIEQASALAEELSRRAERRDERAIELQLNLLSRIRRMADVNKSPYRLIKETSVILEQDSLSAEVAVSNYKMVCNARHDVWYTLIFDNLDDRWQTAGIEARFTDFVKLITRNPLIQTEYDNLRPDLMLYCVNTNTVIIGDITVTSNALNAQRGKHEKYKDLAQLLVKMKFGVSHFDFILSENLANIDVQIKKLRRHCVIKSETDCRLAKDYTTNATSLMNMIKEMAESTLQFNIIMEKDNVDAEGKLTYKLLEGLIDENILDTEFEPYVPKLTEINLIEMIKKKVNDAGGADYFKSTIGDVNAEFNNILENNKTKPKKTPGSVLKAIDNSHTNRELNDLDLVRSYVRDLNQSSPTVERDYLLSILPSYDQLELMEMIRRNSMTREEISSDPDMRSYKVGGKYQYMKTMRAENPICQKLSINLLKGKGKMNKNEKKEPKVIDLEDSNYMVDFVNNSINYYGSLSLKEPFLDDSWDAYNKLEEDNTKVEREIYDYCRKSNGAQLANSLGGLFNRITHMSTKLGTFDNVYIPPNGSFICIMPKEHAPVDRKTCDMPFIFLTRSVNGDPLYHMESEVSFSTDKYNYYSSKLSRLNVNKISCWDNAGHRLVASSTYLLSKCTELRDSKVQTIGLLTYLILDVHQKVSEYLDLLKYISFMPFSDLHLLPLLVRDKCDLLMKTRMDAWMFSRMQSYINELARMDKLEARKPVLQVQNSIVVDSSLGLHIKLPSFIDLTVRHSDPTDFIEEIGMLFTSRPKHLYGSQFLDESTTMTAQWNIDYRNEVIKYGDWLVNGIGNGYYPFESKFAFSADAIHYATIEYEKHIDKTPSQIERELLNGPYSDFLHTNCSLRGCTKDLSERLNQEDMHTTSVDACLKYYKSVGFTSKECRTITIGQKLILDGDIMEFSMSEKDQRGGGRPIATPTLKTKAALMLIEKPEAAIGKFTLNNILVAGKNKLKEQHDTYKKTISHGIAKGLTEVYQLTEDQTKYSENDNPRKYVPYLRTSCLLKPSIRKLQMRALERLTTRRHLVHRLPKAIENDPDLMKEVYSDNVTKGIVAEIGWPQGMLNNISTTIHSAADYWIAKAFKIAYPEIKIHVKGLVHSDDSWVVVCCNSENDFKLYAVFRLFAKKMFCLKLNEKKLWGGKHLGELVSNYNLNGKVHLSTAKVISNGFSNLTYHNWPLDVSNQISVIQQAFRAGAAMVDLVMMSTILRQQIMGAYHVNGLHAKHVYELPIELGGYPKCSVFKLGVTGANGMYDELADNYARKNETDPAFRMVLGAVAITRVTLEEQARMSAIQNDNEDDYMEVVIPSKGEIFRGIRYRMPKSRKVKNALKTVIEVTKMFPSDGLGLIVPYPLTLEESLGHLHDNVQNQLYKLAAERYSQNIRNLAISQVQQSTGKVVSLQNSPPMTMNEMLAYLLTVKVAPVDTIMMREALMPESEVVWACNSIVNTAKVTPDNRVNIGNVINRMPEIETIYDTISPLRDVLLNIIDIAEKIKEDDSLYNKYGSHRTCIDTLTTDCLNIQERFKKYFVYYNVRRACTLIMQNQLNATKERSWVQPKIYYNDLPDFLEGLYGVTLNRNINYKVYTSKDYKRGRGASTDMISTLYSTEILNQLYKDKFKILSIKDMTPIEALNRVDPLNLQRNDYLKYAILQKQYNNNTDIIESIYESDQFVYKWLQPQSYSKAYGRYQGNWELIFKIGRMTGKIANRMGVVSITVNVVSMHLILKAMRLIADRCFSRQYEYDTAWWVNIIWAPVNKPFKSHYYLKYYSYFESNVDSIMTDKSIGINLDDTLNIGEMVNEFSPERFSIDNTLRTITAEFEIRRGKKEKYRVGSVFQDISTPLKADVVLEPRLIDGYSNRMLYKTGIIENLILSQPIAMSKSDIMDAIESSGGIDMITPIWKAFNQMVCKIKNWMIPVYEDTDDTPRVVEEIDYEINYVGSQAFSEYSMNTEIEKLENVQADYESMAVKGQPKLQIVTNITRSLCTQYWNYVSERNKIDFVVNFGSNPTINQLFKKITWNDIIGAEESLDDLIASMDPPIMLFSFIYGTRMDVNKFWRNVNRDSIARIRLNPSPFANEQLIIKEFVEMALEFVGGDTVPEQEFELDNIL